jgi:predicted nuclease with RNAse H fold
MSLKEKIKMSVEDIDVVVIDAPVINEAELEKIYGNIEGILVVRVLLIGRCSPSNQ